MKSKITLVFLILIIAVGGWVYYWNDRNSPEFVDAPATNPVAFSKMELETFLERMEEEGPFTFDKTVERIPILAPEFPSSLSILMPQSLKESIQLEKGKDEEFYHARYFAEGTILDNDLRIKQALGSKVDLKLLKSVRNSNVSVMYVQLEGYEIRISQMVENETKTEIIIYLRKT